MPRRSGRTRRTNRTTNRKNLRKSMRKGMKRRKNTMRRRNTNRKVHRNTMKRRNTKYTKRKNTRRNFRWGGSTPAESAAEPDSKPAADAAAPYPLVKDPTSGLSPEVIETLRKRMGHIPTFRRPGIDVYGWDPELGEVHVEQAAAAAGTDEGAKEVEARIKASRTAAELLRQEENALWPTLSATIDAGVGF